MREAKKKYRESNYKTFGECLRYLRNNKKPKKCSLEFLGRLMGTSRQYVDAIEKSKLNTVPPRYEQTIKMAEVLTNTPEEMEEFLWLAFKERIHSNWEYYEALHTPPLKHKKDRNTQYCLYTLGLTLKFLPESFEMENAIEEFFLDQGQPASYTVVGAFLDDKQLQVHVEVSPKVAVHDVVESLRELSTQHLKNTFPNDVPRMPSLWSHLYTLHTLSPQISPLMPISYVEQKKKATSASR